MAIEDWFLSSFERGNPATVLDSRHPNKLAWTSGNDVDPLVHGAVYFRELLRCVRSMRAGDVLLFTDWRGDPDERLDGPGTEVSRVFADAASKGVIVKGLVWRSHLDRFALSEQQNRHLGEQIEAAGGEVLLDQRVRPGGSHHQKCVILRHPRRAELDVAFVGGIDLCYGRRDDAEHLGDSQSVPMATVYGPAAALQQRHPTRSARASGRRCRDRLSGTLARPGATDAQSRSTSSAEVLHRDDHTPNPLPEQQPAPAEAGSKNVQVLRTYPARRRGYPFAPSGERSVARAYEKVVANGHSLIYVEDQYFWSAGIVNCFADALRADANLHLIAVIPHHPDREGRVSGPPNMGGRQQALACQQ